jgi:hypothetical protein
MLHKGIVCIVIVCNIDVCNVDAGVCNINV